MFVNWENKYNIGIEKIDTQHKELIILINNLHNSITLNDIELLPSAYETAIDQLMNYIDVHFDTEERFFKATKYPELQSHILSHNTFKYDISMFDIDPKKVNIVVANKLLIYLRDWLLSHIAIEDKSFAFYLQRLNKNKIN